jgi:hypothetical protein
MRVAAYTVDRATVDRSGVSCGKRKAEGREEEGGCTLHKLAKLAKTEPFGMACLEGSLSGESCTGSNNFALECPESPGVEKTAPAKLLDKTEACLDAVRFTPIR